MQSLLLPVTHVVLGPGERAYWKLTEPLWDVVGLQAPIQVPRPSVAAVPAGLNLLPHQLGALKAGDWAAFASPDATLPTHAELPAPDPAWDPALQARFRREMDRTRQRLAKLDHRLAREAAAKVLGGDPERLRQALFPFDRPQERVLPGLVWLREEGFLDRMLEVLAGPESLHLLELP